MTKKSTDGSFYFLGRFLRRPRHVASVWPSSRYLAQQMFRGLDLRSGDLIIEYGPGTGAFTVEVERLRHIGIRVRYLGIEKDPGMYDFLLQRFPELDFVLGDARDIADICAERCLPPAAAVISGLPLVLMDPGCLERIFSSTAGCLRRDGVFRTFSYAHSYPTRMAGALRELMGRCFEDYRMSAPVLRNLPPALVLSGRRPREVERPVSIAMGLAPRVEARAPRLSARFHRRGRGKGEKRRAAGGR